MKRHSISDNKKGTSKMNIIGNMSLTMKLLLLVIPSLVALIVLSLLSANSLRTVNESTEKTLYDELYLTTTNILNADRDFYQAAATEKDLALARAGLSTGSQDAMVADFSTNVEEIQARMNDAFTNIQENPALYENYKHPEAGVTLKELHEEYTTNFYNWLGAYDVSTGSGDMTARLAAFDAAREDFNLMTELLEAYAQESAVDIDNHVVTMSTVSLGVSALVTAVLIILAIIIIRYLKNGIQYITGISKRISEGELTLSINENTFSKDEVGQLCKATGMILARLGEYVNYISEIADVLGTMAKGDMHIRLQYEYVGEFMPIKTALLHIVSSLNQTLSVINSSADQVNSSATQVSGASQALASGAAEQAATVEELTASIASVAQQAEENASSVRQAAEYVEQAGDGVQSGNVHMTRLTGAMEEISTASARISNITKLIEDIAFQTNILALNAAIEAARAGAAGKGFAVVADEVRNLAAKSADAAKQTGELILHSSAKVTEGSQIADEMAQILRDIAEKSSLIDDIIKQVDTASTTQASAIEQISQGLSLVSNVVQTNAATAEESSASSEELSAQAATLREEVGKFKLDEQHSSTQAEQEPPASPYGQVTKIELPALVESGKY